MPLHFDWALLETIELIARLQVRSRKAAKPEDRADHDRASDPRRQNRPTVAKRRRTPE